MLQAMFDGIDDEIPEKDSIKKEPYNNPKRIQENNKVVIEKEINDEVIVPSNKGKRKYVTLANDCNCLRDTKIGLYCKMGTRKMRRIKTGKKIDIVCLDCDESGKTSIEISDIIYAKIDNNGRNG